MQRSDAPPSLLIVHAFHSSVCMHAVTVHEHVMLSALFSLSLSLSLSLYNIFARKEGT